MIRNLIIIAGIAVFSSLLLSCSGRVGDNDDSALNCDSVDTVNALTEEELEMQRISSLSSAAEIEEYMRESSNWNSYSIGILPTMASENPEYCKRLLKNKFNYFIVVDKARMKVILFDRFGVEEKSYGMACSRNYGAKHKRGDNRTAEGFFSVEGIYDSTEWLFTDDNGHTSDVKGQFGPRFIRVDIPFTRAIGIHGTCAPWSIGSRCSHGCIRLTNENILDLVKYAEKGMPLIISPGSRDIDVNEREGYDIPSITTSLDYPKAKATSRNVSSKPDISCQSKDSVSNDNCVEDDMHMPLKSESSYENDNLSVGAPVIE